MNPRRLLIPAALGAASALVLAGCATSEPESSDGTISVVTSTDVYGQIVEEIGGEHVTVTPIIASGAQDPHSYEATARDQLTLSRADMIVENGGGYDSFIDALIEATNTDAPVLTAVEFSHDWPENDGHDEESDPSTSSGTETDSATGSGSGTEDDHDRDHGDHGHVEGFNEHVWYDPHTIVHLAEGIAEELAELDPDNAADFTANLDVFAAGIEGLEASLSAIDAEHAGEQVFVTEPVPVYLTTAAGLVNATPEAFSEAVEEGQDVPPATLLEALTLLDSGTVRAVIANAQTGGAETTQVITAAENASIPVLEFTETLPSGQTYLSWMTDNIAQLEEALAA